MKFGTPTAWARYFEDKEGIQIDYKTINRRLKKAKIIGITGRDKANRIFNFHSETDVRATCADLLQNLPQTDESGFFEKDGKRYGTINAWSKEFVVVRHNIQRSLNKANTHSIVGKNNSGRKADFYSEEDIRSVCADVLKDYPQADKTGFFEKGGQKYGTAESWAKNLPISKGAIHMYLKQSSYLSISGKASNGRKADFYSEEDARSVCADFLKDRPRADKTGFFKRDRVKYGTINAWSRIFPISEATIRKYLKKAQAQSIEGRDRGGRVYDFYSEPDVREACADLLKKKNNS